MRFMMMMIPRVYQPDTPPGEKAGEGVAPPNEKGSIGIPELPWHFMVPKAGFEPARVSRSIRRTPRSG